MKKIFTVALVIAALLLSSCANREDNAVTPETEVTVSLSETTQSESVTSASETEKEIGPLLVKERPPLFSDYVKYRLYEIESILKKMGDGVSSPKKEHMLYLKNEYENLLKGER